MDRLRLIGQNVPREIFCWREKDFKQIACYLVESTGENRGFGYESCRLHAYAHEGCQIPLRCAAASASTGFTLIGLGSLALDVTDLAILAPKGNQLQLPNTPLNAVNLGRSTDPRALLSLNTRGVVLAGKLSLAGGVAISAGQAIDRAGQPGANLPEIGLKLGTDVGAAYVTGLFPYGTVIGVAYFILDPTIPVPRTFPMPAYTGDARYDRVLGR